MEKQKERVLAYGLSKIISDQSLTAVSGGGADLASWNVTTYWSGGGSAGSGEGGEVHLDFKLDW